MTSPSSQLPLFVINTTHKTVLIFVRSEVRSAATEPHFNAYITYETMVLAESNTGLSAVEIAALVAVISALCLLLKTLWSRSSVQSRRNSVTTNERPLGALEMFFEEAHQNGGPFICCTVVRLQSSVSLSQDVVRQTLVILAKKHPLLRAKIISRDNAGKCFVVNNEPEPFIPLKILSTVSSNQYLQTMEEEMHKDFGNNLLWRVIWLKENHDLDRNLYENSIVFVTHHALTDGISAITLAGQFSTNLNKVATGSALNIDNIPSYPLTQDVFTLIADDIAWPWWQKALLFPQALALLFKAFQLFVKMKPMKNIFLESFPEGSSNGFGSSRIVYEEMTEEETKRLIVACKTNNCTVQGAVAAAWHLATRKLLLLSEAKVQNPTPVFQWYCPVSVRKFCKPIVPDGYLGCYISSVIDRFQVVLF